MGSIYDQQQAESLHKLESEAAAQGKKVNAQLWIALITLLVSIAALVVAILALEVT